MECLADPVACLVRQGEIRRFLQAGDARGALAVFLAAYESLAGKAPLEWKICALLIRGGAAVPEPPGWPADLLARPSGAALAFVVAQLSRTALELPSGLARLQPICRAHKEILASAWRLWPACVPLQETAFRRRFVAWLRAAPDALGDCLLAAAEIADPELVAELGPLWVLRGLFHRRAAAQVEQASRTPGLETFAREALRSAVGLCFADRPSLVLLLAAAFQLRDFTAVLGLGEAILARGDLAEDERRRVIALQLGALAELDRHEELVAAYRARWLPTSWPFPHPEWLLYVFQQRGEVELEKHLLEPACPTAEIPRWVHLSRDLARRPPQRSDLEVWGELYTESPRDERVLVGVTCAVLRCPFLLREEWVERLSLRERWRRLAELEAYRHLAGAFLVLLQPTDPERIEEYEARLVGVPPALEPVRRAARAYVAALRRSRQWGRLQALTRSAPDLFDLACPFKERELARVMAALGELPRGEADLRSWFGGWERLLSLPLSVAELVEVLAEFLSLRREAERRLPDLETDERLADVALQLLRRAKATAEEQAARAVVDQEALAKTRQRIRQGGLEATVRFLEESYPRPSMDEHFDG